MKEFNQRSKVSTGIKKRTGKHERTIREFKLSNRGVEIGPPLNQFRGILTGVPEFTGKQELLINETGQGGQPEGGQPG